MDTKAVLRELMGAFGPSGYEKEVAYRFRDLMRPHADAIEIDRIGNVIATFEGSEPAAPGVMAFAHLDQLGFIVRKIERDGYIQVDRLGGIPEKALPGLNIRILAKGGKFVDGVIGNKSHHASSAEDKYKVDPITSIFLDLGAKSDAEVRSLGVDVGCAAGYRPFSQELAGDFVSGTSIDNRGGVTALLVAAEHLKKNRPKCRVHLVGTVWEEFNLRGAMIAARTCKPEISLSLDVVLAGDTRDLASRYEAVCGGGPSVVLYSFHGRGTLNGTLPHPHLAALAEKTAAEDGLALQRFASVGILTDSTYSQLEGAGLATLDIGFPCRYTHTPTEVANVSDIHGLGRLLYGMIGRIDRDFPLNRY